MSSSSAQQDNLKKQGNSLVQKQQFEQAATIYTKALELDSTSEAAAAIFSNRSLCYLNTKKYNEALQDAEKAISIRPTWFRGYQRAAAACEKLANKDEEGLKHVEKCFELDEAAGDDNQMKKMKQDFELNIVKQKAPSMTQDELAQIGNRLVQQNQQYQQAIEFYTLAIEKDAFCDEAVPILSDRSHCYFNIGKYKEAYEDGGCCCGIKPDWAKGFMRRGVAAEKLGEWQIALESYDEYLKLDPQDTADVKTSRNAVAKVVADLKKKEEERERKFQEFAEDLNNITDPDERVEKSYELLIYSADVFDIEGMKLALKQPCNIRLDTPFFVNPHRYPSSSVSPFHPTALESARKTLATSPESDDVLIMFGRLTWPFGDKYKLGRVSWKHQVEYLDFLLDVAEEQNFSAPNLKMRDFLLKICSADPRSPDRTLVRKDLIFTLFNRIDTARKVFHGKKASNKEFASDVLFTMCYAFDPRPEQILLHADVSSDVCTQDLYECICTAIEHGANPNINTIPDCASHTLDSAIRNLRSLKVVELFLRYGADPNQFSTVEPRITNNVHDSLSYTTAVTQSSPLSLAFCSYRSDIIRALLRYGAKLPTEQLPSFVLKVLPPSMNPLVKSHSTGPLFLGSFLLWGKPHLKPLVNEEYIQLWFEAIATQNLSFLCPTADGCFGTPLSVAIENNLDINLIELMIKLKPELLRQLYLPYPNQRPLPAMSPLGALLNESRSDKDSRYLCGVAKVLMDNGVDIRKDIVQVYFESDTSDKIRTSAKGLTYTDGLVAQGYGNEKLQVLKAFMMMGKR